MKDSIIKKYLRKILIVIFWLAVWEMVSRIVDNAIVMAGPVKTIIKCIELFYEQSFYYAVLYSFSRISAGFFAGLALAVIIAILSIKSPLFEEVIGPIVTVIKTVPVAAFVVLLLIWMGSNWLPFIISFLVVFPNIYVNLVEGLKNLDNELTEMADLFEVSAYNRFFYIYRPQIKPFLVSSMKISLGMSFKSGIAAEVIAVPAKAIGERLYLSKVYLDTAGVLAYTLVIVILSLVFEKMVLYVTERFFKYEPECKKKVEDNSKIFTGSRIKDSRIKGSNTENNRITIQDKKIVIENISKSYPEKDVLKDVYRTFEGSNTYLIDEPSGSGKTTLLKIISGVIRPDKGKVYINGKMSMLFQEDRLSNDYSAIKNVAMVTGNEESARTALLKVLSEKDIEGPVSDLSGGMRRRVALVRAVEAESDYLLLDEPYTGLDQDTIERVKKYIADNQRDRTLVIASHI